MPGFALGLVALLVFRLPVQARGERLFSWGLRLAVVAAVYVSACPQDWWGGDSYGPYRLASLTASVPTTDRSERRQVHRLCWCRASEVRSPSETRLGRHSPGVPCLTNTRNVRNGH